MLTVNILPKKKKEFWHYGSSHMFATSHVCERMNANGNGNANANVNLTVNECEHDFIDNY